MKLTLAEKQTCSAFDGIVVSVAVSLIHRDDIPRRNGDKKHALAVFSFHACDLPQGATGTEGLKALACLEAESKCADDQPRYRVMQSIATTLSHPETKPKTILNQELISKPETVEEPREEGLS